MALATELESRQEDRVRAFRRARRHSALVQALKVLFPALALGVIGLHGTLFMRMASFGPSVDRTQGPRILPEHLTMQNPRYEGFSQDGGSYVFTADAASQSLVETNLVGLTSIKGTLIDGNKVRTVLTARRGEFDTKTNTLELFEGIQVTSENGLKAKLERATVLAKDNVITSDVPVEVEMPAGTIRSKRMTIRQKLREATFVDTVVARLNATAKAAPAEAAPTPSSAQPLFGGGAGQPIDVTANRLDVNDAAKTATFIGNVTAVQAESTITTPELQILYEGNAPVAGATGGANAQSAKLQRILAKKPVVITRGASERITSETAEFDAASDNAILTGNVVITALPDRRAQGDRAEMNSRADTALLTGAVEVTQDKNVLRGRRLFLDRVNGRTQLSAPAGNGTPAGRIQARLYQKGATAKASPASEPPSQAGTGLGGGAFKTDPNAPVDIDADTLDVNDPARIATFRGNVFARQAGLAISAQEMEAHYSGQMGIAEQKSGGGTGASEITHIDARGKVAVASKDGQTATGDWAKFDIKTNKAVLGGNVVLTQGRNVVVGRRLVIDLATGQSVVGDETAPASVAATPAEASPDAPARSRPQAVFYPKELKDKVKSEIAPAVKALDPAKAGKEDPMPAETSPRSEGRRREPATSP